MPVADTLDKLTELADAAAKDLGLVLVDIRFGQQGKSRTLDVTVHRSGCFVSFEDCETMSKKLEKALDNQSPPLIEGHYLLQVQSPGIDRPLKTAHELKIFVGRTVQIKSREPIGNLGANIQGTLLSANDKLITLGTPLGVVAQSNSRHSSASKPGSLGVDKVPDLHIELNKLYSIKLCSEQPCLNAHPQQKHLKHNQIKHN